MNSISEKKQISIFGAISPVASFDISTKGVQRVDTEDEVVLYVDPFSSIPLYFYEDARRLCIFTDLEDFVSTSRVAMEFDQVGFWENVLFGITFWTRTLYKGLRQLPPASKLKVRKSDARVIVERYWDFLISEDPHIDSMSKAVEGLHEQLLRVFCSIKRSQAYTMGLSGGLDSRLTLSYLSQVLGKDNISLFTFGFSEKLFEYKYAREVSSALGFNCPAFHRMRPEVYREALSYLPEISAGEISIAHAHILSVLRGRQSPNLIQVSNYYSDAVFGYAAESRKREGGRGDNVYSRELRSISYVEGWVKDEIESDLAHILRNYEKSANYSSLDEYLYLVERNPKFHLRLACVQSKYVQTLTPYADYGLLSYMISVPLKFRERKIIINELLKRYYPGVQIAAVPEISSRFSARFTGGFEWWKYRCLNFVNGGLRLLSNGDIQLLNPYHTEELDRLLFSEFYKDLEAATLKFLNQGLLNDAAKTYFDKLPLRAKDTGARYSLISLGALIQ